MLGYFAYETSFPNTKISRVIQHGRVCRPKPGKDSTLLHNSTQFNIKVDVREYIEVESVEEKLN